MPQENIFFVAMLAARLGVQTLAYSFPRVHIITTAVDPKVCLSGLKLKIVDSSLYSHNDGRGRFF